MANNNVNEATRNLTTSVQEANQAIATSAVAAQERNMEYAQSTLDNGIEVLKSHAEDTRHLLQELVEQPKPQQEVLQTVVNAALAAQERNVKFAQSMLQNGTQMLKAHAESTRDLVQTLAEQSWKQQEAFQALARESFNTYRDFLTAPFSYYQQALETAESAAWRGLEAAQHITREGVAAAQKATRQAPTE
jgi:hypothetical protein